MSFQTYLDNIQSKTGKTPEELLRQAESMGFAHGGVLKDGVKAGQIIDWLKTDYDLGHGHAMALVAWFKGKRS